MANEKLPEQGTRGFRINELREHFGLSRERFAEELSAIAARAELDEGGKWTPSRLSLTLLNKKPVPLDDMAAIVLFARARGYSRASWDWFVFGGDAGEVREPRPARPVVHVVRGKTRKDAHGARRRRSS